MQLRFQKKTKRIHCSEQAYTKRLSEQSHCFIRKKKTAIRCSEFIALQMYVNAMSNNTQQPLDFSPRAKFEARFDARRQAEKTHRIRQDQRLQFLASTDTSNDLIAQVRPDGMTEGKEYSICLTVLAPTDENRKLFCGHIFHLECIRKWFLNGSDSCLICRQPYFITRVPDKFA